MLVKTKLMLSVLLMCGTLFRVDLIAADDLKNSLQSTRTLLEDSSAAARIEQSGNAQALSKRNEARELLAQATQAVAEGRQDDAVDLIQRARTIMLEAVRLAGPDASIQAKKQTDYQNRLDSVNALIEAHDRVSKDKHKEADNGKLHRYVDEKISTASSLQQQGKLIEARRVLDEAYVAAKVAIEQLRGGDTLVRSLNFASKEEEYHYEIDRNDTHKMLISVLLEEKIESDPRIKSNVEQFMDKATKIRLQAERRAAEGDFDTAVKKLEESTKEIVRAIRSAGIYIPG